MSWLHVRRGAAPSVGRGTYTITSGRELSRLQRELRTRLGTADHYQFRLPALSEDDNHRLSVELDRLANACGCASGGFVMSLGVVALVVGYFARGGRLAAVGADQLLTLVGVTAALAVTGKLAGLLWARWQMLALVTSTGRRITTGLGRFH